MLHTIGLHMEIIHNLRKKLLQARSRTDELFRMVRPEALYNRPIPERHRIIFYLGHLEAFDWNQIRCGGMDIQVFNHDFDQLFSFGIDPKEGDLPDDIPSDWPRLEEVQNYNCRVRQTLDRVLQDVPEQILHVAVEHRLMHAETLAYMLHNLAFDLKFAQPASRPRSGAAPGRTMLKVPGGAATLGRRRENGFGWDNEFEAHVVEVPEFAMGKYKVTNGDYLEFVRAGAGPLYFWTSRGGGWFYRGMFGEIALPLDWPVYVTFEQACSFAQWAGKTLPSEAQFHRAAYGNPNGAERSYPWGEEAPDYRHGNFDFRNWDPLSVCSFPNGDSAFGISQLAGNGWEWTSTVFHPFPGFQPFPFYPGYSADFFDGAHYVLKGASPRTANCFLRRSYRNWFRPSYPYVYASFRLVDE